MSGKLLCKFLKTGSKLGGSGRNQTGKVTIRSRCVKCQKTKYPIIDYIQRLNCVEFIILKIYASIFKTGFIALIYYYKTGIFSQILTNESNKISNEKINYYNPNFDIVLNNKFNDRLINSSLVGFLPLGSKIFNLELVPGSGSKIIRAAGCWGTLVNKIQLQNGKCFVGVVLPSNEIIYVSFFCRASVGFNSNKYKNIFNDLSAGSMYKRGRRSKVRGVAMNPVDHPHGGGEGKTSGGRSSVSKWGFLTKGKRTRSFVKQQIRIKKLTKFKSVLLV